jgi:hypothetical protein
VHDGLLEARGAGERGIHVQGEEISREAVEQGLIGAGPGVDRAVGAAAGEFAVRDVPSSPPKPPSRRLKMLITLV